MNEIVGNLIRVNKYDAEVLYYNGLGVILNSRNMNPTHPMSNKTVYKFSEQKESFDKLLNAFVWYNRDTWYWTDINNKKLLDERKKQYKNLRSKYAAYDYFNVSLAKSNLTTEDVGKISSSKEFMYITLIYAYLIKYKPISIKDGILQKEIDNIAAFLQQFVKDKNFVIDKNVLYKVLVYIGF